MGPECWKRYCIVHSVVRWFFCCLVPGFPLHPGEVQFQLWSLSCILRICRRFFCFFLRAAIALVSLRFLYLFIEIFMLFSISLIWFSTFSLVWWFVYLCICFCNFDPFLNIAILWLFGVFVDFSLQNMFFFANFEANGDYVLIYFINIYICENLKTFQSLCWTGQHQYLLNWYIRWRYHLYSSPRSSSCFS